MQNEPVEDKRETLWNQGITYPHNPQNPQADYYYEGDIGRIREAYPADCGRG